MGFFLEIQALVSQEIFGHALWSKTSMLASISVGKLTIGGILRVSRIFRSRKCHSGGLISDFFDRQALEPKNFSEPTPESLSPISGASKLS